MGVAALAAAAGGKASELAGVPWHGRGGRHQISWENGRPELESFVREQGEAGTC